VVECQPTIATNKLRKVPPLDPFPSSSWPEGVRGISIGEVDGIGVNAKGELYWRGKPVEIRRPLDLSRAQKIGAVLVATFTVIGGIGAGVQGWAAYNELACKLGWRAALCPKPVLTTRNIGEQI
jgi:hypothetical protein